MVIENEREGVPFFIFCFAHIHSSSAVPIAVKLFLNIFPSTNLQLEVIYYCSLVKRECFKAHSFFFFKFLRNGVKTYERMKLALFISCISNELLSRHKSS